jgi:hypothetical protein
MILSAQGHMRLDVPRTQRLIRAGFLSPDDAARMLGVEAQHHPSALLVPDLDTQTPRPVVRR